MSSSAAVAARTFRAGILQTFVGQVGFAAIAFVASVVAARLLEPAGRGELGILVLVPTLLLAVLELGQEFTGSHLAARTEVDSKLLHGNLLILAAVVAVPAFVICGVAFRLLLETNEGLLAAGAGGAAVAAGVYLRGVSGIVLGSARVRLYNGARLALAASSLVAVLALWLAGAASPRSFYLGWCGGQIFVAVLLGLALRVGITRPNRQVAVEQWRVGLPVHIANTCQFLLLRVDLLFLAALAGSVAVGHYAVATNVVEAIWYLPAAAGLLSIPFLSGTRPESEKVDALLHALRLSFWFSVVGGLALAALAPFLVPLVFGADFAGAVKPLELLIPGVVAAGIARTCSAAFIARRQPGLFARIAGIALVLNIGLNAVLVPQLGVSGAAIAASVSYLLLSFLALRKMADLWDLSPVACLRPPNRNLGRPEAA
jgi:O-antigen/teichoic acid export membrane protein